MSDGPDHSSSEADSRHPVRLADIFTPTRICTGSEASTLKRMIDEIAGVFARNSVHQLDKNAVFRALLEREQIGSTWITDGVAIPHCRLKSLSDSIGVILRLKTPLCVDSRENKFVSVACGLLVPEKSADSHVHVLSRLAQAFMQYDLYSKLMKADDPEDIYDVLSSIESEIEKTENPIA